MACEVSKEKKWTLDIKSLENYNLLTIEILDIF